MPCLDRFIFCKAVCGKAGFCKEFCKGVYYVPDRTKLRQQGPGLTIMQSKKTLFENAWQKLSGVTSAGFSFHKKRKVTKRKAESRGTPLSCLDRFIFCKAVCVKAGFCKEFCKGVYYVPDRTKLRQQGPGLTIMQSKKTLFENAWQKLSGVTSAGFSFHKKSNQKKSEVSRHDDAVP